MNRQDMLALAERCEQATADNQHIVIMAAMDAIAKAGGGDAIWDEAIRFHKAGAYLDAAMTLVPEGLFPILNFRVNTCRLSKGIDDTTAYAGARTMPLAICAAALRSRANLNDKSGEGDK